MSNLSHKFSIAIDGTAASGKSTVAKLLAEKLKCSYLDTGKLYRAIALDFLTCLGEEPEDWAQDPRLGGRLKNLDLRIQTPPSGECRIQLFGEDINARLSDLQVESATPYAARLPIVREYLLDVQRQLAEEASVVMAGRDIGTVVLPNATLKIFVECELQERARRRLSQHQGEFTENELCQAIEALRSRDDKDTKRECAPLACAVDAISFDSTSQSAEELASQVANLLRERL